MNKPQKTLIIGPSSCGKTYTLLHDNIARKFKCKFDHILIICNRIWINNMYIYWQYLESDTNVIALRFLKIN